MFFLCLVASATCQAWQGGEGAGLGQEGYEGGMSNFAGGWVDPSIPIEPTGRAAIPGCHRTQTCNSPIPTWVKLYILNPIQGALRTGWD